MSARIFSTAIVVFWLTMTGLLVRTELHPSGSRLSAVPVGHVLKLLFLHEQSSDLNILSNGQRLGYLRFYPKVEKETQRRLLEFIGNLQIAAPKTPKQRFSWDGGIEMNRDFEIQRVTFGFTMHEPEAYRIDTVIDPQARFAQVLWKAGERVLEDETYTLDEVGAATAMEHFGIDPMLLRMVGSRTAARPEITAQQSSMLIRSERVETYLVTCKQNGQTLLEIQVSQIGQILEAKTFFGYTLAPEDLTP